MSLCTRNRWGAVSCSTSSRSETDKEMEEKLKKIKEERDKQDTMWISQTPSTDSKK